ncbi:hypothetical protein PFISCL1PPCAC_11140, partial [Pristionchus fissidentatus]
TMFSSSPSAGHWSFGSFFDNVLRNPLRPLPFWMECRQHIFYSLSKLQLTYIPALVKVTKTFVPFPPIPSILRSDYFPHPDLERNAHSICVGYFNAVCDVIEANLQMCGRDHNVLFIVNREMPRIRVILRVIHLIVIGGVDLDTSHSISDSSIRPTFEPTFHSVDTLKNEMSDSSSYRNVGKSEKKSIVHLEKKPWLKEKELRLKNKSKLGLAGASAESSKNFVSLQSSLNEFRRLSSSIGCSDASDKSNESSRVGTPKEPYLYEDKYDFDSYD